MKRIKNSVIETKGGEGIKKEAVSKVNREQEAIGLKNVIDLTN